MEMSVGTIVTIVLLMAVLVLGLVLVRTIFTGATENIEAIDEAIKSQISTLFSEDNAKKVVILPASREFSIKKGESGGFAFSIRNTGSDTKTFNYDVKVLEVARTCRMSVQDADRLLILGRSGAVTLPSLEVLEHPIHVNFRVPDDASKCDINYALDITGMSTITIKLEIK